MQATHPDDQTLKAYGLGKLDDGSASTINDHLEDCAECREKLSGLSSDSFLGKFRDARQPSARSMLDGSLADGTVSFLQAKAVAAPPPTETLPPGLSHHPDYEIKRELGRGGMGVVYLAHNTMMGRDEVLKVMGRQIMERPGVLERFQREIRAVAKLRHPNIVAAYHAFRIEGGLVFSMEYVEGLDLARLVKAKGPLSVSHAAYFVHQAALGLQHAHERGLIHRDIKPHNLMLTHDGKARLVKVLDFGLAKATREEKIDGGLTSEGQALGTPDYIAPEQITNAPDVDIRADLYSLGGTLFYLLTGRPPFQANSLYDIYQAHMSRDVEPLNLIRPEIPAELAALVSKMMAKEPKRRFQNPAEAADALKPFFKSSPLRPPASRPTTSQVAPPAAAPSRVVSHPPTPGEPDQDGVAWDRLIDLKPLDTLKEDSTPVLPALSGPGHRRPPRIRTMLGAAGLAAILFGIIIYIQVKKNSVTVSLKTTGNPSGETVLPIEREAVGEGGRAAGASQEDQSSSEKPLISTAARETPSSITNSIGMKLVLIPAGSFEMGSPDSDPDARKFEKPRHLVRITKPFYLGTTEVTQGQYRAITGKSPSKFSESDDLPVERVSWNEAVEFCKRLDEREHLVDGYRLPTEAEWEYACRAGSTTRYSYGDDEARLGEFAWFRENSGNKTHPVAQKRPNAWGLYDMPGSVREWCADRYKTDYYDESTGVDPLGPSESPNRVTRGGSWAFDSPVFVRSAYRGGNRPEEQGGYLGFRVARVLGKAPGIGTMETTQGANAEASPAILVPSGIKPAVRMLPSDLDRIATGKWIRLVDSSTPLPQPDKMKFQEGILELDGSRLPFANIVARDVILRAKVRKISGDAIKLDLRYQSETSYAVWFDRPDLAGPDLSIRKRYNPDRKRGDPWTTLAETYLDRVTSSDQFISIAFAAIGDTLTVFVDGKKTLFARDPQLKSGNLSVISAGTRALFKDVEYQILDAVKETAETKDRATEKVSGTGKTEPTRDAKPGGVPATPGPSRTKRVAPAATSELDRVATGKWIRLVDSSTVISDPKKMKFQDGILELDQKALPFPEIIARDVIVRARVRMISGVALRVAVRKVAEEPALGFVAAWGGGDLFSIGRTGPWKVLDEQHTGREPQPEEFIDLAIAAIGDRVALFIDGQKLVDVWDDQVRRGFFVIEAYRSKVLFRDVEYQILDPVSPNDRKGSRAEAASEAREAAKVPRISVAKKPSESDPSSAGNAKPNGIPIPLFTREGLAGLKVSDDNKGTWQVADGILSLRGGATQGDGRAMLVTKRKDYTNFRLHVVLANPDGKHKQIQLRRSGTETINGYAVVGSVNLSQEKPEVHAVGSIGKLGIRAVKTNVPVDVSATPVPIGVGEWYTLDIAVIDNRITTHVNGTKVAEYLDDADSFKSGEIAFFCRALSIIQFKEITIEDLSGPG